MVVSEGFDVSIQQLAQQLVSQILLSDLEKINNERDNDRNEY